MSWTLQWLPKQTPVSVQNQSVLDDLLDSAERNATTKPFMVELRSPAGTSLTIGLGSDVSVETFVAAVEAPPYFVSTGGTPHGNPLVFYRDGHWSEFESEAAISPCAAREAARTFLATGVRPSGIAWREV